MRVFLDFIGCRLNQSEIETIGNQFRYFGHIVVDDPADADVAVINTCTVTANAAADSRKKIRHVYRAGCKQIIATGCWVTLEPDAADLLPGVKHLFSNDDKNNLVSDFLQMDISQCEQGNIIRQPLPGSHQRTRAFIKVQDGCDNHCTYCITRIARGKGISRPIAEILTDINNAFIGGAKEIVLSGVHLGSWGHDFTKRSNITQLISAILKESDIPRIRLSSLEPWDLDDQFFDLWLDKRMCRHLHLPLQSGSAAILKRMGRNITPESYALLINNARRVAPRMAITTDVIVGFPGEGEREFQESLDFIKSMRFSGGHVFSFSPRSGTPAARFDACVPKAVAKERSRIVREEFAQAASNYREDFIREQMTVLWEKASQDKNNGWLLEGLTDNYIRVKAFSDQKMWNTFSLVEISSSDNNALTGKVVNSERFIK